VTVVLDPKEALAVNWLRRAWRFVVDRPLV
jgi:hypothetical protein